MTQFETEFSKIFGFLLAQEFQKAAPKNTGELARSFIATLKTDPSFISFILPDYFYYVEFGTVAHIIKPKNKKALYWKGAEHPYKIVRHPGTKPNPFVRNTINTKTEELVQKTLNILEKRNISL